jgi:LysM repeat protein/vacuolar-type H+-ATPase subunit H
LQLLDERTREVDALVQHAKEEARRVTYDAEKRAQEITAEAERQRAELDEQVAILRSEVAGVREELAQLRAAQAQKGARGAVRDGAAVGAVAAVASANPGAADAMSSPTPTGAAESSATAPQPEVASLEAERGASDAARPVAVAAPVGASKRDPVAAADVDEALDAAGMPRWGRPSSIAAAQQAIRARARRPRWLPRWLPFVILLLAGAGAVTASVNGQSGGRGASGDQTSTSIAVAFAPTAAGAPTRASDLGVVAMTSIATSVVMVGAAGSLGSTTQPGSPSRAASLAAMQTTATSATLTPRPNQSLRSTRTPAAVAPPPAPLTAPSGLPLYDVSPDGPIVAAYTTYATYTVRPGDTLNRVATEFGATGASIIRASRLADPNLLLPGQVLTIPRESGWLYRVQRGETIETIALHFDTSTSDLMTASGLTSPIVRPGDVLFIPNRGLLDTKQ